MPTPPLLTILLPARNAAGDLPGFLASAERYADAVVALDDGSTDGTRDLLGSHPLVKVLIENPPRASYACWDDAANRNALLRAAGQLDPQWILSLDADERIDATDGAALREFLETDALPGLAYFVRCYPTETENGRYSHNSVWVARLFAYQHGQRFPSRRLHFAPIPLDVPRTAHIFTTFRIQHLGGMTPQRRHARYEKYRQADPDSRYWPDYTGLLEETPDEELETWKPRKPGTSPLYSAETEDGAVEDDSLTIIAAPTHRGLAADSPTYELIVSTDTDAVLDRRLVERAGGSIVLALPPNVDLNEGSFATIVEEHAGGYGMVAPSVDVVLGDGWTERWNRWQYAATRVSPELSILDVRPTWCSYRRSLLLEALSADTPPLTVAALNTRLHLQGYPCVQSSVRFTQASARQSPISLLRAAYGRGRSDRSGMLEAHRLSGRLVQQRGRRGSMMRTAPPKPAESLPMPLAAAHAAGSTVELIRPRRGALAIALGRPQLALLVILSDGDKRQFLVVSWSATKRSVRVVMAPPWVEVERPDGSTVSLDQAIPTTGRIPRFVLHEHFSRPFSIQLDDVVRIRSRRRLDSVDPDELFALSVRSGLREIRSIATTIDRISLGIFLTSARRANVETLTPWTSRQVPTVDADRASAIAAFFAGHLEVDRRNLRERLRLVKWC